ncbi:hypothetical protein ON010_g17440 [Phytophthora cinnamomi]|nr:hypothetical protein ON010_g17440 [Phytophthora cinnamomi]
MHARSELFDPAPSVSVNMVRIRVSVDLSSGTRGPCSSAVGGVGAPPAASRSGGALSATSAWASAPGRRLAPRRSAR